MMKLEKMDDFFAARIDGYAEHMKRDIEGASGFYAYTASLLPLADGSRVLDLDAAPALSWRNTLR
jgi:tRNA (cmo5U34)-methyltransferase